MKMQTAEKVLYTTALPCVSTISSDLTQAILLHDHSTGRVQPMLLGRQEMGQGNQALESSSVLCASITQILYILPGF